MYVCVSEKSWDLHHALKRSGKNRVVQIVQNLYSFLSRALIKATIVLIIKA